MRQNNHCRSHWMFEDVMRTSDAFEDPALTFEAAFDIAAAGEHPMLQSLNIDRSIAGHSANGLTMLRIRMLIQSLWAI